MTDIDLDHVLRVMAGYAQSADDLRQLRSMLFEPSKPSRPAGRPPGPRPDCGTIEAYRQHLYWHEPTDDACKAANAARVADWKQEQKPEPECGTIQGYKHHLKMGEPTCPACRRENTARVKRQPGGW